MKNYFFDKIITIYLGDIFGLNIGYQEDWWVYVEEFEGDFIGVTEDLRLIDTDLKIHDIKRIKYNKGKMEETYLKEMKK